MPLRNISVSLAAALSNQKPTLQVFLKITCTDNTVLGFTKFPQALVYNSVNYLPGLNVTVMEGSVGLSVDNLEISGIYKTGIITEAETVYGKYDGASYELFILDYEDLTAGAMVMATGRVRDIRSADASFTVELASLSHLLQATVGHLVAPHCWVKKFGDSECGIVLTGNHPTVALPYRWTGAVITAITNRIRFDVAMSAAYPTEFFQNGELLWQSGSNVGVLSEIKQFVNNGATGYFILQEPPRKAALTVGDTFRATAGCNRTWSRCGYFQNRVNFRGFPNLIGQRRLYQSAG